MEEIKINTEAIIEATLTVAREIISSQAMKLFKLFNFDIRSLEKCRAEPGEGYIFSQKGFGEFSLINNLCHSLRCLNHID